MTASQSRRSRRPYAAPELSIHGDVKRVTSAVGKTGNKDGSMGKAQKTGP